MQFSKWRQFSIGRCENVCDVKINLESLQMSNEFFSTEFNGDNNIGVGNTYMWYENAWLICTKWYTWMIRTANDAKAERSFILRQNDFLQFDPNE